jgi:hypothetical protein
MTAVDWFLRDRSTGRIVVAQRPNAPLVVWLAATGARIALDPGGGWGRVLEAVAAVALAWWAGDEIVRGVNPWRRLLGATVLAWLVVSLLR